MAQLDDGRTLVYGTMGGDGQPQTQAVIYTRYAQYGQELQQCVTGPRWLLGRTWGVPKTNVRIENRFTPDVLQALAHAGHDIEIVGPFDEVMGHAGAIVRHPSARKVRPASGTVPKGTKTHCPRGASGKARISESR